MIVSGQTGCGKTYFIHKLLQHYNDFDRVILCCSMFQSIYKDVMQIQNVELHEGFPDEIDTKGQKTLLILDDLMFENDKRLATFFTRMRHANLSTIFVTQNFYFPSKYMRTVTRNAHYLVPGSRHTGRWRIGRRRAGRRQAGRRRAGRRRSGR
ncbi:MAG: ATP-binding protein [Pseudomonadota bacterium]